MLRWNNDYNHGAHPEILKALSEINDQHFGGYGFDEWCDAAKSEIKSHFGAQADRADIHFLAGGTQANLTVITAALRPVESVVCVEAGHINVFGTVSFVITLYIASKIFQIFIG